MNERSMKHRTGFAALALAASLLLSACGQKSAETQAGAGKPAAEREPIPIETALAQRAEIQRKAEFVGSLAGVEELTVSSEAEGTVESVRVDLGDPVAKGQLLLTLAPDEFRFRRDQAGAEVDQVAAKLGIPPDAGSVDIEGTSLVRKAAAEYGNAKTDLERRRELFEKKLIARKEVDDAEARFQVAEANQRAAREEANNLLAVLRGRRAQLSLAEKKLRDAEARSPVHGSVQERLVSAGEYVKAGTPLFRLVNDRPIRLLGEVPEAFAPSLRPGLPVELAVDGHPGKLFRGTLQRIAPSSNVSNRAIQIEAVFRNEGRELKAGFFGKGAIVLRLDREAVTVPKQAVITFAGIDKLFVISEGVARERKVRLGADLGDRVEVTEGVRAGEAVAISGLGKLVEGAAVRVPEGKAG